MKICSYDIAMMIIFAIVGGILSQIAKVCYEILVVPDEEKEPQIFRIKNFKSKFNIKFAIPCMIILPCIYLKYRISFDTAIFSLLTICLIAIFAIDYKYYIIPDKLNLFCAFLGIIKIVLLIVFNGVSSGISHLIAGVIASGIFLTLAGISIIIYKQEGMGFGDIKLMFGLGCIFGIKSVLVLILISFVVGAVISVVLMIAKKKSMKQYIPFGPFICFAAGALMFIPAGFFVDWYFKLLIR